MFRKLISLLLIALAIPAFSAEDTVPISSQNTIQPQVSFAILKTAKLAVQEALVYAGGSVTTKVDNNFSAFLVRHGKDSFLFDTGLGSKIADQYRQDMPWWQSFFFRYDDPVDPVSSQLARAGMPPVQTIILSHCHWDHASGISDFPDATVWLHPAELEMTRHSAGKVGGSWPSQVGSQAIKWKTLAFKPKSYNGFSSSIDLYEDGSVVLVPMIGHTPGSIGMFVTVDSGKRFFFVGDVVWNAKALKSGSPKFFAARWLVDGDIDQTQYAVEQIQAVLAMNPDIIVVPAHDGSVQQSLGYFPFWVK